MARNPDDPFDLRAKNLRRVVPQVRRNIKLQRDRVIGHIICLFVLLAVGILGVQTTGVLLLIGFGCLLVSPLSVLGIFADRHLMRWHQRRLAECEHQLSQQSSD